MMSWSKHSFGEMCENAWLYEGQEMHKKKNEMGSTI